MTDPSMTADSANASATSTAVATPVLPPPAPVLVVDPDDRRAAERIAWLAAELGRDGVHRAADLRRARAMIERRRYGVLVVDERVDRPEEDFDIAALDRWLADQGDEPVVLVIGPGGPGAGAEEDLGAAVRRARRTAARSRSWAAEEIPAALHGGDGEWQWEARLLGLTGTTVGVAALRAFVGDLVTPFLPLIGPAAQGEVGGRVDPGSGQATQVCWSRGVGAAVLIGLGPRRPPGAATGPDPEPWTPVPAVRPAAALGELLHEVRHPGLHGGVIALPGLGRSEFTGSSGAAHPG